MLKDDLAKQYSSFKHDSLNVEKSLRLFLDQLRDTWNQVQEAELINFKALKPRSVVLAGMGGSSLAGRIVSSVFENQISTPLFIYNDYGLAAWVNCDDLVIINSYSGNTEESLSSLKEAQERNCKIIGITTGGKLGELVKSGEIGGIVFNSNHNPTGLPKAGLGESLGALFGVLSKSGIIPLKEKEVLETIEDLEEVRRNWLIDVAEESNLAKGIAGWLFQSIPVLISSRPLLGPLYAGRNVVHEVGRTFAAHFDLPELDHHLVEATELPKIAKEKIKYLFFYSEFAQERVRLRYKITQDIFRIQGIDFRQINLKGSTILTQALELSHFCAWVSFYLSMLNRVDPGPEPWILKLKNMLIEKK